MSDSATIGTENPASRIPTSRRDWSRLMAELGIRPNKGLGQHFLFERGIVERMVRQAGIGPGDSVLEVGPGLGILTSELLRKVGAGHVVAVEYDRGLAAHLETAFGDLPNFELIQGNALHQTADDLFAPGIEFDVVANLPYSTGTAILRHLLEQPRKPRRLTVMLQKEVAERITAQPPDMSILSVATQYFAEPRVEFIVSPTVFIPPPKVESAVIHLDVRSEFPVTAGRRAALLQDRHLRLPSEAQAGRQRHRGRAATAEGGYRRLVASKRHRPHAPRRNALGCRVGHAHTGRA